MRTALLAVAAVAAAGLVVPVATAAAGAADPQPAAGTVDYRDPAQSTSASVSVTGTLTPIHSEVGVEHSYAVSLPGGAFIPVSLGDQDIERPQPFRGTIAITDDLADELRARGTSVADGEDVSGSTSTGKAVIAAADGSTVALPVQTATIGAQPTQNTRTVQSAATTSTHRLYVAVMNNRGALDSSAAIASETGQMMTYWKTESDGLISAFDTSSTVSYASTIAPSAADGCGMSNPSPIWKEAAGYFPGVDFSAAGNHLMVLVPNACGANGAAGVGTVGSSLKSGGRTMVTLGGTAVAVGVHELGHNLSLAHANAETCSPTCSTNEYWDLYSIMGLAVSNGSWTPPALDTSYRLLLGVDDSSSVPTVTTSTTVHLSGRATTSGTRGFVVTDPSSGAKYSVDYRSGTGRDAQAFYAPSRDIGGYTYRPGVVIERMESSDGSTTMMTHQSGNTYVTSFGAGESFSRGSLTIKVNAASGSAGADVAVTLPAPAPPSSSTPAPASSSPVTPLPTVAPPTATTPSSTPSPSSGPSSSPTPSSTPSPTSSPTPTSVPPSTFSPGTPSVQGTARVGQRLYVTTTAWSPTPDRYSVQWLADGRPLAGAVGSTFVPSRSEYGKRISIVLTGYRDGVTTASRTSAATGPVTAGRFSSRNVHVVGKAKVGRTLRIATGSWEPSPSFSFRWYANGKVISKATGPTLKVTKSLRGKRITARVTARQYAYEPSSRSVSTGRVR